MTNRYEELQNYSCGNLFKAFVRRLFEKKAVCFSVSAAAILVSLVVMDMLWTYHNTDDWKLVFLQHLVPFVLFIAGASYLLSNIGGFGKRKFCIISVIVGSMLWAAKSVCMVLSRLLPTEPGVGRMCGLTLLKNIPLLIVSLIIVLLPVMIKSRKRKTV